MGSGVAKGVRSICHEGLHCLSLAKHMTGDPIFNPIAFELQNSKMLLVQMAQRPSFTLFPQLPTEIRLQIWREVYNTTGRRVIELRRDTTHSRCDHSQAIFLCHGYSPAPVPPIFHTSQEAREVALQLAGRPLFGNIYFNPALDTLYLQLEGPRHYEAPSAPRQLYQVTRDPRASDIRRLAMEVNFMNTHVLSICDDLSRVPNMSLEEIIFVVEELDGDRGDDFMRRFGLAWDGLVMVRAAVDPMGEYAETLSQRPKRLRLAVKRRKDLGLAFRSGPAFQSRRRFLRS